MPPAGRAPRRPTRRGAAPRGAVPPGAARPGAAPRGAAPRGAARRGAARHGRPARHPGALCRKPRGRASPGWSEGTEMSAHVAEPPVVAAPVKSSLPLQAVVYLVTVLGAAVALGGRFVFDVHAGDIGTEQWATFAVLATASALAQLFVVITPRNQSYHMSIVFIVPAALLLPPELLP